MGSKNREKIFISGSRRCRKQIVCGSLQRGPCFLATCACFVGHDLTRFWLGSILISISFSANQNKEFHIVSKFHVKTCHRMECVCCFGYESKVLPLSEIFWIEIVNAALEWLRFDRPPQVIKIWKKNIDLWKLSFDELDKNQCGYHSRCRSSFTNKSKLICAQRTFEKLQKQSEHESESDVNVEEDITDSRVSPPPRTRQLTKSGVVHGAAPSSVLEAKCIICLKGGELRFKEAKVAHPQPLSKCELPDGGKCIFIF